MRVQTETKSDQPCALSEEHQESKKKYLKKTTKKHQLQQRSAVGAWRGCK
jgi:hypothetical protein